MKTKHEQKKKREQMSREIIQRHAGVFQIDGQQQAQLHIDEVKESDLNELSEFTDLALLK